MINEPASEAGAHGVAGSSHSAHKGGRFGLFLLIALGVVGCLLTVLGLDGANGQQLSDFDLFYFPAMQAFAADPVAAIANYPAAPTPLYFMLQGGVLALTHDPAFIRIVSILLGAGVIWATWRFPASQARRLAAIAVLLISPYFRGQVWFSNNDVLALLLMLIALRPEKAGGKAWFGKIALANVAVYVRQTFVFLPMWVYVRGLLRERRPVIMTTVVCAVMAAPMLWLVKTWGGIAPPQFAGHLSPADLPASLSVGITIAATYLLPMIVVRALTPKRIVRDVAGLPVWLHAAVGLASTALVVWHEGFGHLMGGGLAFLAAQAGEKITGLPMLAVFIPAFIVCCYVMALVVRADPWRNGLVLLATLLMSSSLLIYQRYFDPLIPLLLLFYARVPEIRWLERKGLLWTMALPSVAIALIASVTH